MLILRQTLAVLAFTGSLITIPQVLAQITDAGMSFFVTSTGIDGANLGGIEGADMHCQKLADAVGAGDRPWAAYLSTQGVGAVNARDRIGTGPWYNVNGKMIAESVDALHREDVNINHESALDETGAMIPYVHLDENGAAIRPPEGPSAIEHDILTGTQSDGTAFPAGEDKTCSNWTSNGEGSAILGHHDRRSLQPGVSPWSSAHPSQGCSQEKLVSTGGSGRFYCFATD